MIGEPITDTKQQLIDSALVLFAERGYHGTSMRHVAKHANLALGGIYNHFANKEEMFKAVILTYHPFVVALPEFEAVEGASAEELLRNAAYAIVGAIEKRPEIVNLIFIEMVELKRQHLDEIGTQIAPQLMAFVEKVAAKREQLRPLAPMAIVQTYAGLVFSYFVTGQLIGEISLVKETATLDDFLDVYLYGVLKREV